MIRREITYSDGKEDGSWLPITLTEDAPRVELTFACFALYPHDDCRMSFMYRVHDRAALAAQLAERQGQDDRVVIATIDARGQDGASQSLDLWLRWSAETATLDDPIGWPRATGLPPDFYDLAITKATGIDEVSFELGMFWPR